MDPAETLSARMNRELLEARAAALIARLKAESEPAESAVAPLPLP
jgi:hypothetical protein